MILALCAAWWLVGILGLYWTAKKALGEITRVDALLAVGFGILGPISAVAGVVNWYRSNPRTWDAFWHKPIRWL